MKPQFASSLTALAASALFLAASSTPANALDYTWDTVPGDAATITAASGTWSTTGTNWNHSSGTAAAWAQTSGTVALHNAIFAGADGTYTITLSGTNNAQSVAFNNSGYTLTSGTLTLKPTGTTNGNITVAANKTATINSNIAFNDNRAVTITSNAGSTLNLGGGASNSQYTFTGAGTVNMTAGAYTANVGRVNVGTFNQTGGTFNMSMPIASGGQYAIGNAAGRSVTYTMSGNAIINANSGSAAATNAFLAIGRGSGTNAYTNTLNVTGSSNLNVGNTAGRPGELLIASDNNSNGTLNVTGGAVLVGTGTTDNKIYLFKAGSGAGYSANLTQSGGTITANGIQFGGTSGTYDATSSANLTLSGGVLYVGLQGITRGSSASALPTSIKLQGGAIGASDSWSSSLNMQLGATNGGPAFQAATSGGVSKTITLSGNLSNDTSVNGILTKTGAGTLALTGSNSFSGGVIIRNGTLESRTTQFTLGTGTVTMGGAGSDGATYITGQGNSNQFVINAPDSGNIAIGANGAGSGFTLSGGISLNGNLNIRTFDNVISGATKASAIITGGVTGTGNLLLNNLGLAANTITLSTGAINNTGSITVAGSATGDTTISASIGANVTSVTQNSATSRLVLTNNSNAYTGATNVNAGTLVVNGNISTSTLTTVSSGATLGGSGTLGAVTVAAGATLAPGNSPGTLNTGTLTLNDTSVLSFELNPTNEAVGGGINDLVSVTGNLTLDGILNVVATSGSFLASASEGMAWRLFNYSGTLTNNLVSLGSMPTLATGNYWHLDTVTAGQVNLAVIPEPGAALLGGLGVIALLRRRRD